MITDIIEYAHKSIWPLCLVKYSVMSRQILSGFWFSSSWQLKHFQMFNDLVFCHAHSSNSLECLRKVNDFLIKVLRCYVSNLKQLIVLLDRQL